MYWSYFTTGIFHMSKESSVAMLFDLPLDLKAENVLNTLFTAANFFFWNKQQQMWEEQLMNGDSEANKPFKMEQQEK